MINLHKLEDLGVQNKRVLLRMDLDVDDDFTRIESAKETLYYLLEKKGKTIIIGHKGRPKGKVVKELSLEPLAKVITGIIGTEVRFVNEVVGEKVDQLISESVNQEIILLENLRFEKGEEENDEEFAKELASVGDVYVNEAFAVAHRNHASITGLPNLLPHAAGFRFSKEVEALTKVTENPRRPIVGVISGVKKDKIERIAAMLNLVDTVLVGGRLPIYLDQKNPENLKEEFPQAVRKAIPVVAGSNKVIIANLVADTEDITIHSIEKFKDEIAKAGTLILAGVPGKYEDPGHLQGTKEVFEAIAESSAYKVAGGGDAEAAITLLGLNEKFDWISVGGGAMLEFLAKGTLPGIEALRD